MKNILKFSILKILVIVTFLIFPGTTFAELTLVNSSGSFSLPEINYLEDQEGNFSIQQVLEMDDKFTEMEPESSLGVTQSTYWFRFSVKNNTQRTNWFVELGAPFFYEVDLFSLDENKVITKLTGNGKKFSDRLIKTNQQIIPLNILPGESKVYYLRLKTRFYMRPQLKVADMQTLYEANQVEDILNGIYFGLLIAMMAYNLFVFISTRDKTYLFYVLYTLFLELHIANMKGYGVEFIWSNETLLTSSIIWISLGIIFGIFFSNSFLHTRKFVPKLYKFQWTVYITIIISLILSFAGYEAIGFIILAFNPTFLYYVFIMGIAVYRKGFEPARFYVIGFGVLVISIFSMELVEYNIIDSTLFTEHFLQLGSAIEAIVLSYALAAKLNFYKKEKEEAQLKALQQSKEFSHKLIRSQEGERKRIAAELHDSIGQSLILIKNKILLIRKKSEPDKILIPVGDLTEMVSDTIQEVRTISYGLRPFQLDLLGLTKSIHELIDETEEGSGIHFKREIENINGIFSKDNEINMYRIIQECLNNIVKHSNASEAAVYIKKKDDVLIIFIEDYGVGFTDSAKEKDYTYGFGLLGIKERLNILGGSIEREKSIPSGTTIIITLPVPSLSVSELKI